MEIYKIVKGNGFLLHVVVQKLEMAKNYNRLVDFDMSLATHVKPILTNDFGDEIVLPFSIQGEANNEIVCVVPSTLDYGRYGMKLCWEVNDTQMTSYERNLLAIVYENSQTRLPLGRIEGATAGLFNTSYYMETENVGVCTIVMSLNNVVSSNMVKSQVNGEPFRTTLTPTAGFGLGMVRVTMNGNDITPEVYDNTTGVIDIASATGYVTIMADGDTSYFWAGASAADDLDSLFIDSLDKHPDGDIVGKTVSVVTTEEKPYVWFVSRVPVVFYQAGISANLNEQHLGDLYYYHSDKLTAGENTYTAQLRL